MNIDSIKNGLVIDHITPGNGMKIYHFLGLDELETIPLVCEKAVKKVEILNSKGERVQCDFTSNGNLITVKTNARTIEPIIMFIS